MGKLTLTKTVTGLPDLAHTYTSTASQAVDPTGREFTAEVTTDGQGKGSGEILLPYGSYTVRETGGPDHSQYRLAVSYGGVTSDSGAVEIGAAEAALEVVNAYEWVSPHRPRPRRERRR